MLELDRCGDAEHDRICQDRDTIGGWIRVENACASSPWLTVFVAPLCFGVPAVYRLNTLHLAACNRVQKP